MNIRNKKFLEGLLEEVLEDYNIAKIRNDEDHKVLVFYNLEDGYKIFEDYEVAEEDPYAYAESISDDEERKKYLELIKNNNDLKAYNIIYPGEEVHVCSYPDLVWILICLLHSEASIEVKVIYYYLALRGCSSYRLALSLGISKQALSQFLNGVRKLNQNRLEQIAKVLDFSVEEYLKEPSSFVIEKPKNLDCS